MTPSINSMKENLFSINSATTVATSVAATLVAGYLSTKTIAPLNIVSGLVIGASATCASVAFEEGNPMKNAAFVAAATFAGIITIQYGLPTLLAKFGFSVLPTIGFKELVGLNLIGQMMVILIPRGNFPITNDGIKNFGVENHYNAVEAHPEQFADLSEITQVRHNAHFAHHGLKPIIVKKKKEGSDQPVEHTPTLSIDVVKAAKESELRQLHALHLQTEADPEKNTDPKTTNWKDLISSEEVGVALLERFAKLNLLTKEERAYEKFVPLFEKMDIEAQWSKPGEFPLVITAERLAAKNEEKPDAPHTPDATLKSMYGITDAVWITLEPSAQDALKAALKDRLKLELKKDANPTTEQDVKGLDKPKLELFYNNFGKIAMGEETNAAFCARFYAENLELKQNDLANYNLEKIVVPQNKAELDKVKENNQIRWIHAKAEQDLSKGIKPTKANNFRVELNKRFRAAGLKNIDFSKRESQVGSNSGIYDLTFGSLTSALAWLASSAASSESDT